MIQTDYSWVRVLAAGAVMVVASAIVGCPKSTPPGTSNALGSCNVGDEGDPSTDIVGTTTTFCFLDGGPRALETCTNRPMCGLPAGNMGAAARLDGWDAAVLEAVDVLRDTDEAKKAPCHCDDPFIQKAGFSQDAQKRLLKSKDDLFGWCKANNCPDRHEVMKECNAWFVAPHGCSQLGFVNGMMTRSAVERRDGVSVPGGNSVDGELDRGVCPYSTSPDGGPDLSPDAPIFAMGVQGTVGDHVEMKPLELRASTHYRPIHVETRWCGWMGGPVRVADTGAGRWHATG